MTIDSADDSKILNQTINTNRISNRRYDSKSNRITKLRRSLVLHVLVHTVLSAGLSIQAGSGRTLEKVWWWKAWNSTRCEFTVMAWQHGHGWLTTAFTTGNISARCSAWDIQMHRLTITQLQAKNSHPHVAFVCSGTAISDSHWLIDWLCMV